MRSLRRSPPGRTTDAEMQTKKRPCADLRRQFLELQSLRERVRIAQCGRMAPPLPKIWGSVEIARQYEMISDRHR
jgi:hypothetical protein